MNGRSPGFSWGKWPCSGGLCCNEVNFKRRRLTLVISGANDPCRILPTRAGRDLRLTVYDSTDGLLNPQIYTQHNGIQ